MDSCSISKSDVVLELGTGFGYLTKEISSFAKSVYSYEIDLELYIKAKKYLANNSNVKLFNKDFFAQSILNLTIFYQTLLTPDQKTSLNGWLFTNLEKL